MKRRFLVDLNVVLDVLLERGAHARPAAALWAAIESGAAEGLLAAHGVTTLHYLARRHRGARFAKQLVGEVLSVFEIVAVNRDVLLRAVAMPAGDFEDAVTASRAIAAACDAVVTRDPSGFRRTAVTVLAAEEALALLEADEEG